MLPLSITQNTFCNLVSVFFGSGCNVWIYVQRCFINGDAFEMSHVVVLDPHIVFLYHLNSGSHWDHNPKKRQREILFRKLCYKNFSITNSLFMNYVQIQQRIRSLWQQSQRFWIYLKSAGGLFMSTVVIFREMVFSSARKEWGWDCCCALQEKGKQESVG